MSKKPSRVPAIRSAPGPGEPVKEGPDSGASGPRPQEATILLAEDDEVVQAIIHRTLARAGYRVLTANDGGAALQILQERGPEIDLFLTDVVLPKVLGHEVAAFAVENFAQIAVLFVSGYAEDPRRTGQSRFPRAWFLAKPFTPEELLVIVRSLIDAPPHGFSTSALS